ncbi:MAG: transcriptional regulator [Streptomycetaceae bacterium]|nr:transcriptional regulator [Streptomycetaceae bacterium]
MTPAPSGPTHRRQLGAELRRLRTAVGLTTEQVAAELKCSHTRVSRIETAKGRVAVKPADIRAMCKLYGVTDERQIDMLLDMLTNAQQRGWWESYERALPSGLDTLAALESDARAERTWEPLIPHGLLQTEDYARAVIQANPNNRYSDVDDMVAFRVERQKLLTRGNDPLEFWEILDEGVLHRPVGGTAVMRAQLQHLVTMAEAPNITIQVMPTSKGAHPGLDGAFSVLEFESDDPVVYVESPAGNLYMQKKHDVRRFVSTFDLLRAMALAPDESTALLRRTAEEIMQ